MRAVDQSVRANLVRKQISSMKVSNKVVRNRVRPRFSDQVGHETMHASSRNKHLFTKSCHHQTYQNYEQPPRTSQNSYTFKAFFLC